jgi:hypothetical protein
MPHPIRAWLIGAAALLLTSWIPPAFADDEREVDIEEKTKETEVTKPDQAPRVIERERIEIPADDRDVVKKKKTERDVEIEEEDDD